MQISILSNLIALKDEQIQYIKDANVSIVQTSLYSMDPAIHDLITTVKGSQAKTKAAIEKLVAADIPVQISCPVMKANYKGYGKILQFANSLKIKAQTDYIMMAQADLDTSNLANRISMEETEYLLRDMLKWDNDYKENTLRQRPKSEFQAIDPVRYAKQPLCGAGNNGCCITANGDVYPCAGWQALVCGNIYKQSLRKIWETSIELKKVRAVTRGNFAECLKCEAQNFCAMCLVRNYNENNGDMFQINRHFCEVAFLNKKIVEEEYLKNHNDLIKFKIKKNQTLPDNLRKMYNLEDTMCLYPETTVWENSDPTNTQKNCQIKISGLGYYRDSNNNNYPKDIIDQYYDLVNEK
ncbi:MAG: radical SAM protein [Bacteroidales bacterium]|nr:radical SAM protein [Bacteroidales bacterium]